MYLIQAMLEHLAQNSTMVADQVGNLSAGIWEWTNRTAAIWEWTNKTAAIWEWTNK